MKKFKVESLQQARQQIDAIDIELVELIAARQFYVDQTIRFKKPETDLQSPERMSQIISNVRQHAKQQGLDADLIERFYRDMFAHFVQREMKEFRP